MTEAQSSVPRSVARIPEAMGEPAGDTLGSARCSAPAFSINFIRDQRVSLRVRRRVAAAAVAVVAVNLVVLAGLLADGARLSQAEQRLERQATASAGSISLLVRGAHESLTALRAITAAQGQRFIVAGRLAAIAKTLPARTWITQVSGKRQARAIVVQAAHLVDPAWPQTLPAKAWLDALKADPVFSRGLKRLELGPSTRKRTGNSDLYDFQWTAEWEAPAAK